LLKHVLDWEISEEESLADHNYIKFKLSTKRGNNKFKTAKYSNAKYVVREDKLHLFDNMLLQEMQKYDIVTKNIVGAGAIDSYISNEITKRVDIKQNIGRIEEAIISTCGRTFGRPKNTNNNSKKNSVPWWNTHPTVMRKKVNANRRLYHRTKNDEDLREWRKATYKEAKRYYQAEINKAKLNSWKEYCNVAAAVNPWSQVYKIATGKTKEVNKMTTINRPDGRETTSLQETINEILDYLYKEDGGEENPNHKTIRKAVEEPIHTEDDVQFTPDEIKHK